MGRARIDPLVVGCLTEASFEKARERAVMAIMNIWICLVLPPASDSGYALNW